MQAANENASEAGAEHKPSGESEPSSSDETREQAGTPFTAELRDAFIRVLSGGLSTTGACQRLGVSPETVRDLVDRDPVFRARVDAVTDQLSQNIASALYRKAMDGNVTAQTNWLRLRPPPEWRRNPVGADAQDHDESLDGYEFGALLQMAVSFGIDLAAFRRQEGSGPAG